MVRVTIVDGRGNGVKSLIAHRFRLVLVGAEAKRSSSAANRLAQSTLT